MIKVPTLFLLVSLEEKSYIDDNTERSLSLENENMVAC